MALSDGLAQISKNPQSILDICTGTGLSSFMAAEKFPLASVVGVGQSASMIHIANGKVQKRDHSSLDKRDSGLFSLKVLYKMVEKSFVPNKKMKN